MTIDWHDVVTKLRELQRRIRHALVRGRGTGGLHDVSHESSADTIYRLDLVVEPVVEEFCEAWGRTMPIVVVAEGIEPETGRVFPAGARDRDVVLRIIIDPIDGTRGLMYDKRAAWSLAGAAPNKGPATRLADVRAAVMTELPTSKMAVGDVLWAVRGCGARGERESIVDGGVSAPLPIAPSRATSLAHGFASVSNFFPGTKVLAGELAEHIARRLLGPADVTKAALFEDQYISTGGQFYELIVGHDRFNADLRPVFYAMQGQGEGLCCHPYDCAALLIACEAGVILTDARGEPLDGPMDVTTGVSWIGYANESLRAVIAPVVAEFLNDRRASAG